MSLCLNTGVMHVKPWESHYQRCVKTWTVKQTLESVLENCGSVKYETKSKTGIAYILFEHESWHFNSLKSNILLTSGVVFSIWDCPERKDFQLSSSEKKKEWSGERLRSIERSRNRECKKGLDHWCKKVSKKQNACSYNASNFHEIKLHFWYHLWSSFFLQLSFNVFLLCNYLSIR